MMAGPLWAGCSFSWSKTLPPLNSQGLIVGKTSSIKGLIVSCLFGLQMKKTKRWAKRDKEGSEPLLLKYLIPHSLSYGFQATSSISFKVYLNGVCVCVYVCGGGAKEKEKQREKCWRNKVLWFDYLSPLPTFIYFFQNLLLKSQFPM